MIKKTIVLASTLLGTQALWAELTVNPWWVNFGRVQVRSRSHTERIRVTNNSDQSVEVNATEYRFCSRDFAFNDHCTGTLDASATCTIDVTFYPFEEGVQHCDFGIYADGEWQDTVSVEGRGAR